MTAPRRILVTGSREWRDKTVIESAFEQALRVLYEPAELNPWGFHWEAVTVVHGDCRGADRLAGLVALRAGMREEKWPAAWSTEGKAAGPKRNARMVEAGAHICLGFPLGKSSGTRDCMARAEKAGITVMNFGDPDR